ncbi:MAG: hypothetical protein M0R46_15250 [Candidatus Muirbacterium halophilum]|nr:hypothetical protein [Candidatus Muirbacterium halophilum]
MLDNNVKVDMFIQFIKDNSIYNDYMKAYKEQNYSSNIIKDLLSIHDELYLVHSFVWYKTNNGYDFWSIIDDKWLLQKENYYKQYKRNKILKEIL